MSKQKGSELYPRHRLHTLEPYYSRHVAGMTELPGKKEGLHGKSDIAERLAWRDQAIEALRAELASVKAQLADAHERMLRYQSERNHYRDLALRNKETTDG